MNCLQLSCSDVNETGTLETETETETRSFETETETRTLETETETKILETETGLETTMILLTFAKKLNNNKVKKYNVFIFII